jgi:hypothetical protein
MLKEVVQNLQAENAKTQELVAKLALAVTTEADQIASVNEAQAVLWAALASLKATNLYLAERVPAIAALVSDAPVEEPAPVQFEG